MDKYFEELKQNDFNKIEPYYIETFYNNTSKEKWEELFYKVHSILFLDSGQTNNVRTHDV